MKKKYFFAVSLSDASYSDLYSEIIDVADADVNAGDVINHRFARWLLVKEVSENTYYLFDYEKKTYLTKNYGLGEILDIIDDFNKQISDEIKKDGDGLLDRCRPVRDSYREKMIHAANAVIKAS